MIDKNSRMAFAILQTESGASAIDKTGELVLDVVESEVDDEGHEKSAEMKLLEAAVEEQLGLPRSRPIRSEPKVAEPREARSVLKGKVVDLDGRPIVGARVSDYWAQIRQEQ